ncbi:flavodoxin family protein [Methylobacterium sp. E-045]|uniref:flavodoxin family protein n=1 Tax=Methylobacterium sp. E-045 TaxID=2836575 RepID=UPI001FBBA9D1|nr:NAD(P)H-dependent oxidoreductase [Methylobacterium sp. E-045]MCJ2131293.1 NAD(P)H-dependent oxidoreductase [Methylobacterium sp. E-045]
MGTDVALRFLDDHISGFLRDCRTCRGPDGACTIADGYRALFFEEFLPARAVVFCSPIYWYGLSAQTKAFFDRRLCHDAASNPSSERVLRAMSGKRLGVVLASEETYPGAALGIVHQMQEFSRYTHSDFVGVVRGVGNSRGEVRNDPDDSIRQAERLGAEILDRAYSDYRLDTKRAPVVWQEASGTGVT